MIRRNKRIFLYLVVTVVVIWFFIFRSTSTTTNSSFKYDDGDLDFEPDRNNYFQFKPPIMPKGSINILYDDVVKNNPVMIKSEDSSNTVPNINNSRNDDVFKEKMLSNAIGLTFRDRQFYLNGKKFQVFSGAIHYFRVLPDSWRDRLLKLKACGLNTVETYVPWNLHEPNPGVYYFIGRLNLRAFIQLAGEIGLYVILRPGPYICAEVDFGGLPGWLLEDDGMRVRTNNKLYLKAVIRYFRVLLPQVKDMQFTEGGPIIMVQVENEYAVYGESIEHLKMLAYLLRTAGIQELLVTSDNIFTDERLFFHEYALPTSNAANILQDHYNAITSLNPHFPFMVMELWSGWFTTWGQTFKSGRPTIKLTETIQQILVMGGSFNLYMFHGGTNFGFHAGAINITKYGSFLTSYDYDALLTEAGDITPKYLAVRSVMQEFYKSMGINRLPAIPSDNRKMNYGHLKVEEMLEWSAIHQTIPVAAQSEKVANMEKFVDTHGRHLSFGYIIYSTQHQLDINNNNNYYIQNNKPKTSVKDRLMTVLKNRLCYISHGSNAMIHPEMEYDWERHLANHLHSTDINKDDSSNNRVDLIVENQGRIGYSTQTMDLLDSQRKGLDGPVFGKLFGDRNKWEIRFLTFDRDQCQIFSNSSGWTTKLTNEMPPPSDMTSPRLKAPSLFKTHLHLTEPPKDTFIQLKGWTKGLVIVNRFNVGRYWKAGPQANLYLPRSLLHVGQNEILVFEEEQRGDSILLTTEPGLGSLAPQ